MPQASGKLGTIQYGFFNIDLPRFSGTRGDRIGHLPSTWLLPGMAFPMREVTISQLIVVFKTRYVR